MSVVSTFSGNGSLVDFDLSLPVVKSTRLHHSCIPSQSHSQNKPLPRCMRTTNVSSVYVLSNGSLVDFDLLLAVVKSTCLHHSCIPSQMMRQVKKMK